MKRRILLGSALATACLPRLIAAQGTPRFVRIGWLTAQQEPSLTPYIDTFRAGLADFGYVEGRNLAIEFRFGNDNLERVPELASQLALLPVELMVVQGAAVALVNQLRLPVPVVYAFSGDPVSAGFADSLARPHENMTGLTFMAAELNGKRLELLSDMIPQLRRVALVANPEHPGEQLERAYSEEAGRRLGLRIEYFPTRTQGELVDAFTAMALDPPQAISLFADGFAIQNRRPILDFAMSHHIPVISGWPIFARSGAVCTYGPRLQEAYRRLAYFVDRILNGAKPVDLPIEQPTKFELVVNLKSAKALAISIPQTILGLADEVIE